MCTCCPESARVHCGGPIHSVRVLSQVMAINSIAPFVLCSKLRLSMQSPFLMDGAMKRRAAFIVNVSSMEGTQSLGLID